MKFQFDVGGSYSRRDVALAVGLPDLPSGGSWLTGYVQHDGTYLVFCGVGTPGRTGHDYGNRFEGDELAWSGKTRSHRTQPMIAKMTAPDAEVHIFWRQNDRDNFTYAGLGRAISVSDDIPARVRWRFTNAAHGGEGTLAEEIPTDMAAAVPPTILEGAMKRVTVNAYERNPVARKACLAFHGYRCAACGFDFEAVYGDIGRGYIHVHHLRPLSSVGASYVIDPIKDLIPLCANCHAMIHRSDPPLAVDVLATRLRSST
ncbi:HNH endonuclease [Burkholderia cenocepacia]|jgi:5-methylcytosine-specific restriction protein A|uniref:HNH endonuclease n=1 Tax=Burkholderia cenocepacia TaxID=95486 RepID=UPI0008479F1A|nr:HNH endonuclease [Burkholderia cenocepacia]